MNAQTGSAETHGTIDDFLGHSNRSGSGAAFLDNWKNRKDSSVRVVLHPKASVTSVWQHPWPKIVEREKDGKITREVWGGQFNSWELQAVLQRQYLREDDGSRVSPPAICPMSLMLEEVDRLMREGELHWATPLFRFVGDDPDKAKVLHAGSIVNKVKKIWETVTDDEKRKAMKAGFPSPKDGWKESMMAKCQYVFTVVDYDDVEAGIQIDKETTLVGDKAKKAIRDRMTSEGDEKGNPLITPYVIQFSYNEKGKKIDDKYDVVPIAKLEIGPDIEELLKKEPPDVARYTAPGDVEELRASMEDAYCGPEGLLDFDFIFAKAEAIAGVAAGDESEPQEAAGEAEEAAEEEEAAQATKEESGDDGGDEEPDRLIAKRKGERCFTADGVELFGCEDCGALMREDETVCHKCGADYSEEGEELDIANMTAEECEAALQEELDEETQASLKARIEELSPAPKRTRKKATTKKKAGGKAKGGKASKRAAAEGRDVGF